MNALSATGYGTGRAQHGARVRALTLVTLILFAVLALALSAVSAHAQPTRTDTVTSSCVFAFGTATCVRQYRSGDSGNHGIKNYAEQAEDAAEARERDKAWEARCRPILRQDFYGVSRYVYAAPGCEYGRLH